jgi:hypothetical protein
MYSNVLPWRFIPNRPAVQRGLDHKTHAVRISRDVLGGPAFHDLERNSVPPHLRVCRVPPDENIMRSIGDTPGRNPGAGFPRQGGGVRIPEIQRSRKRERMRTMSPAPHGRRAARPYLTVRSTEKNALDASGAANAHQVENDVSSVLPRFGPQNPHCRHKPRRHRW